VSAVAPTLQPIRYRHHHGFTGTPPSSGMPRFERGTRVDASLDDVWAFHSRVEGLEALTPDWMGLRVEEIRRPDDETDVLVEGTEIDVTVRPFGVGPRQGWTSCIETRTRDGGSAMFRDRMVAGPFDRWVHTHSFAAVEDGTLVHDHVEYDLPGPAGPLGPLARLGFEPMFRYRHRETRSRFAADRD